ncbi:MAG: hypothetical protein ACRCZE_02690 [Candidatus Altimarinota bacterium]
MNKPPDGFIKHLKKRAAIVMVGATAALTSKLAYHHEVKQTVSHQGEIVYTHTDPDTNRILNYLSGREKFSIQERRALAFSTYKARLICNAATNSTISLPSDFVYMNEQEVLEFLKIDSPKPTSQIQSEFELQLTAMTYNIPEQYDQNDNLYRQLWELEAIAGAPRIRWASEINLPLGERTIAHYSLPNTLYITPVFDQTDNPYDDLVAEASHAIQFQNNVPDSYAKLFSTIIHTTLRTAQSENPLRLSSFNQAYGEEYQRPGSIEHEAHSQIEPALYIMFPEIEKAATPPEPTYDLNSVKITVNLLLKPYISLPG